MTSPRTTAIACGRIAEMASSCSTAPRGEPGSVMMRVLFATPAIPRDKYARGLVLPVKARASSINPGCWREMTLAAASGVTSRGESPVPPVLTIKSIPESGLHQCRNRVSNAPASSGRQADSTTSAARCSRRKAEILGPDSSRTSPRAQRSEAVRTAARRGGLRGAVMPTAPRCNHPNARRASPPREAPRPPCPCQPTCPCR